MQRYDILIAVYETRVTLINESAEDTLTATQVAKTFNMTTLDFNAVLRDMGIQYRHHGCWNLSDDLQGRGYTAERDRYGAIWLHFAVRPKDNRRKVSFINA